MHQQSFIKYFYPNSKNIYLYLITTSLYGYFRKKTQIYYDTLNNTEQYKLLFYSFIVGPIRFPTNILYDFKLIHYNHPNKYIKYLNN
jgi:hypothetical protein